MNKEQDLNAQKREQIIIPQRNLKRLSFLKANLLRPKEELSEKGR